MGSEMRRALGEHWPEYLMEGAGFGLFMLSACTFTTLLFHPGSPIPSGLDSPIIRRCLMGLAMALTAVSIIYSPWGRRSGAHLNPAVTLTFWRLGKIAGWDAASLHRRPVRWGTRRGTGRPALAGGAGGRPLGPLRGHRAG